MNHKALVSVVIRTLNEEKHLPELLTAITNQNGDVYDIEVVIVDSGSTDATLDIAESFNCRITHICKSDFTFGRSLNLGCEFANGKYLVFISGHCIPCDEYWVNNLVEPIDSGECVYSYGRQVGRDSTKFSERQLFAKYFPDTSRIPQEGFFCNNANSALLKDIWNKFPFDESLTGCEDMFLAKQLIESEYYIAYIAEAPVYHIHDESWLKVRIRYEREAVALQKIMPQIHITFLDVCKYIGVGIVKDMLAAIRNRVLFKEFVSIFLFRISQYYGAYKGNHEHRKISSEIKMKYFYPRVSNMDVSTKIDKEVK